jgi:hypothetical protein
LPRLLDSLIDKAHLLRIKAGKPGILGNLILNERNSEITANLYGWLSLFSAIEVCLRPTPVTLAVEIYRSDTFNIVILDIYLQIRQRINDKTIYCCLFRKFFFCSSVHEDKKTLCFKAI